ncbi:MAG: hypothetical protein V4727_05300 [Verrucomicrobiota bacterium]
MGKIWLRVVSGALVLALLALTIATWKMIGTGSGDKSEGLEKKPQIRYTKEERDGVRKAAQGSVDTAELRKEALEILGRVEAYSEVMDFLPDAARLSAIFRQWGEVDFEEAKRFLETEELAKKMQRPDRSFADDLILVAIIGYSKSDPIKAWEELLPTQDYSKRPLLLNGITPYPHEVVTEEVMRALFRKSDELALKTLRELDSNYNILLASSLRVILAESDDAEFRKKVLDEFLVDSPFGTRLDAGMVCGGLAEHDPKSAWEFIQRWSKTQETYVSDNPEMIYGRVMVRYWSQRQPKEALRFVAELHSIEHQDTLLMSLIISQSNYHPELIVEVLEIESLKRLQEKILPEVVVEGLNNLIPWPLMDENVPLSLEKRYDKLQQAVESSNLPVDLKERFLTAIEAKRGK